MHKVSVVLGLTLILNEAGRVAFCPKPQRELLYYVQEQTELTEYLFIKWRKQITCREVFYYMSKIFSNTREVNPRWEDYKARYAKEHMDNEVRQLILTTYTSLIN